MKQEEIESQGVFRGKSGEERRVLEIRAGEVSFEVVANPFKHFYPGWAIGSRLRIRLKNFAAWAVARVDAPPCTTT